MVLENRPLNAIALDSENIIPITGNTYKDFDLNLDVKLDSG